jgi:hypothetical protein
MTYNVAQCFCPNNSSHTLDVNTKIIKNKVSSSGVRIEEEETKTDGFFKSQGCSFSVAANQTLKKNLSWEYPINVSGLYFFTEEQHQGDDIECRVAPETTIGALSQTVTTTLDSATVYTTSITQQMNAIFKNGFFISFLDTVTAEKSKLFRIISIDRVNLSISFVLKSSETVGTEYTFGTNLSLVQLTIVNVEDFKLIKNNKYDIGSTKIGCSYVPANRIMQFVYKNNSNAAKTFSFNFEYLY